VPNWKEEELSQYCVNCGANGLSESLDYTQPDLTYDPDLIPKQNHDVDVYFEKYPNKDFFAGLNHLFAGLKWEISEEQNKDWQAEWKKGFVPFQLCGPYWVVPSWMDSPTQPQYSITIDPGMAFGTGTHATTQMAAYFIHKLCEKKKQLQEMSLLDVGTGTGILAMLAKKHGVGRVVGVEIDAEARRVARENININQLSSIQLPETQIEELKEKFDIVVANIIDGVLLQLREALLRQMKAGGNLFLTGILAERENDFFEAFITASGLQVVRRLEQDEWIGYWLRSAAP